VLAFKGSTPDSEDFRLACPKSTSTSIYSTHLARRLLEQNTFFRQKSLQFLIHNSVGVLSPCATGASEPTRSASTPQRRVTSYHNRLLRSKTQLGVFARHVTTLHFS
jgi:hypothetical protein